MGHWVQPLASAWGSGGGLTGWALIYDDSKPIKISQGPRSLNERLVVICLHWGHPPNLQIPVFHLHTGPSMQIITM